MWGEKSNGESIDTNPEANLRVATAWKSIGRPVFTSMEVEFRGLQSRGQIGGKSKSELKWERVQKLELLEKPSECKNIWSFGILDLSMPTLKSTGVKGHIRDCVATKGTFLVLGVVGIVGAKAIWSQIEILVAMWLISLDYLYPYTMPPYFLDKPNYVLA